MAKFPHSLPKLKDDSFKSLRQYLYDLQIYIEGITNISGDGQNIAVTQSKDGTVVSFRPDEYNNQFPFFTEADEGGLYSKYDAFDVKGGFVHTPNASFELVETQIQSPDEFVYLKVFNVTAGSAATIPTGFKADGITPKDQQDIDPAETGLYGQIVSEATAVAQSIDGDEIFVLLGTAFDNVWTQSHVGDFYIPASGGAVAETVYWHGSFSAAGGSILETWAVDADVSLVPPLTELRPEVIPAILYTVDGCARNDFRQILAPNIMLYNLGVDEVTEPDPETEEIVILDSETMYFYVKFTDAYNDDLTYELLKDTAKPDLTLAPDGEKWLMLYTVKAESLLYTEDDVGIERTGIKYTIEQHNENCIELDQPSIIRWARTITKTDDYEYSVDIYQTGNDAATQTGAIATGQVLLIDDYSNRLLELNTVFPVTPNGNSYRLSGYYLV